MYKGSLDHPVVSGSKEVLISQTNQIHNEGGMSQGNRRQLKEFQRPQMEQSETLNKAALD